MNLNAFVSPSARDSHTSTRHDRTLTLRSVLGAAAALVWVAGCGAAGPATSDQASLGSPSKPGSGDADASGTPATEAGPSRAGDDGDTSSDTVEPPPDEPVAKAPAAKLSSIASPNDGKPRLWAPVGLVKIHDKPDRNAPVIGAYRAGMSVVMKDTSLTPERKLNRTYLCDEGWYPVEPRGFVCVGGGDHAVKDANDPRVVAARAALPDVDSNYPYRVGHSVGAPQYLRIPTAAEQKQVEGDVVAYRKQPPAADDKKGGAIDLTPAGKGPSKDLLAYIAATKPGLVHEQQLYDGYKISWAREFDANGRTWLLTPDMTIVPKDKVRVKATPTLKGIHLKEHPEIKLPLAFFWLGDSKKYVPGPDGKLMETDEVIKRHSFVETTTDQAMGPGGLYWKLRDGSYVKYQDITVIQKRPMRIGGVGPNDKWVEVRVTWGYLAAYKGDELEFVTAMSPGIDGINAAKHATARGKHHVDWKLYTGDMSGKDKGKPWYVDEVPWVQYYKDNYALHGAWWHNNFGRPMSHGCINLSPPDAKALFNWMDPAMPEGWYAVAAYYPHAKGTMVYIRP